jgi:hypothetical protein
VFRVVRSLVGIGDSQLQRNLPRRTRRYFNSVLPVAKEVVMNTDVVLWYMSSMYHEPHNEDGEYVNNQWKGVALTMWSGFDLRPRNLFDRTPLYP